MAKKRRQSERVEPVFDVRTPGDGRLGGVSEKDRTAAKATGRRAANFTAKLKPAAKPAAKRPAAPKGRTRKRIRPLVAIGSLIRATVYWSVVAFIIVTAGLAGVFGYYWSKLPPTSEWTLPKRPANIRILAADGRLITNRGDNAGASLRLGEMPPWLPEAVIAIEDQRFYWHFGIDPIGLVRATAANWRAGSVVQGGSTLTQQLAKNLFLTPERTFERKIQEVILSLWLEASLSKSEILELYLNRVYLGAGAYGVDAAAHRYFGKSARDVTIAEAAALAGLLKAPGRYSPLLDRDAAEARARLVIAAMRDAGYITDRDAHIAMAEEIRPVRDVAGGSGRYVADWVMDMLPDFVGSVDVDIAVETTIDVDLQAYAAWALADTLDEEGATYGVGQGAFVAMDPDGAVRALVGGRDYAKSPFNRAVDAVRQPGSAFKPFVYLAALENGLRPNTVRVDQPIRIGKWSPENYTEHYLGPVTLTTALALSLNTVSAELTAEVGARSVVATARRLGITAPLQATPSIALGTSEVSLLELTGAFAPFANGGRGVIPHVIERIVTNGGKVLYRRTGSGPGRVVAPAQVAMMNGMLRQTVERGTGKRAMIAGWPAAGKTGTSQDFRDAWFVGYTGALVAGVWFGNDNARPTKKAAGSNLPATAWQRFMSLALDGVPVVDLPGNPRGLTPTYDRNGVPVAAVGEGGEPLHAPPDAVGAIAAGPPASPPDAVGATPAQPEPRRKGFFRRLFGGG